MTLRMLHAPDSNFIPGTADPRPCLHEPRCSLNWAKAGVRYGLDKRGTCAPWCGDFVAVRAIDALAGARRVG